MKTRLLIIATIALIGLGIYILVAAITPEKFVPKEFSEARIKGAQLAVEIVALATQSLNSLQEIAGYDEQGNAPEALILISREVIKNKETSQRAINLSGQLEKMARLLEEIEPARARILATEAVSSEVALVSRLLNYNDLLRQLFETLRDKLEGKTANPDGKVRELVDRINKEAQAINDFDRRFNQSLAEFDKIFAP